METEAQTENNAVGLDPVDPMPWDGIPCPKCNRRFKNAVALRMHDIRKHQEGRGWDTGRNFKGGKKTKQAELARKREYNKRMRERFYAEGRNSRGEKMPTGWKHKPRHGGNTGMKLARWSPERRAKFNSTWRSKNKAKNKATLKEKIQIVYPDPREQDEKEAQSVLIPQMQYCPHCGEYLKAWRYQS